MPQKTQLVDDDPKYFIADTTRLVVIPHQRIARASVLKVSSIGYVHAVIPVDGNWAGTDKAVSLAAQSKELPPLQEIPADHLSKPRSQGRVHDAVPAYGHTW